VAIAITTVRKVVPELVSLGLLVILIAPGLQRYYVTDVKDQWRETATYVTENATEGDALVFVAINNGYPIGVHNAFNMYNQRDLSECLLSTYYMSRDKIRSILNECRSGRERLWLVTRVTSSDEDDFVKSYLLEDIGESMHLIEEQAFHRTKVYLVGLE
jgi:hypothetical protein